MRNRFFFCHDKYPLSSIYINKYVEKQKNREKYLVSLSFYRNFARDKVLEVQYMKYSKFLAISLSVGCVSLLTSCFKDEPLNAECDIEQAYIHAGDKLDSWFEHPSDTLQEVQSDQTAITFTVTGAADITKIAPQFRITEGATIQPANGSVQDFSNGPVTYVVTSQDKKWSRTYTVAVKKGLTELRGEHKFDFEDAYVSKGFYNWDEPWDGSKLAIWTTGNSGYQMSNPSAKVDNYPTVSIEDGYEGKGVKLTTCRTSGLADMVKKPIAAGNLFIGKFNATDALTGNAMQATKFGYAFSFASKPVRLEGWYKYKAGEKFTDKNMKVLTDRHDFGTIYAVLYDNHDAQGNAIVLYGDNVQTSPQVVALALVGETHDDNGKIAIGNTDQWTHFSVTFDYATYGKTIDPVKLKNGGYSLAIVCSSSTCGADFMGAVGSTLWVDSFKIICE